MLVKAKQHLKTLFNYAVTVVSCVVIIVLGISFLSRATTVTTTIGENISTNDLIVYGNATTTGAHYVGGSLTVNGDFTVSGAQTLSGAITIPYFNATSTTHASTIVYRLGIGTSSPYATLSVAGIGAFDDYVRASYFTATSTTATSTLPYLTSTQSNLGTVVGGTWQGTAIGTQYGGTGQNFSASTGFIYLNAGTASASSTLAINVGGTGLATAPSYGQVLLGTANGGYALTATSSLGIVGMSIGNAVTSGTGGSVLFVDGSGNLAQNNSNFYWDNTNARLGIGTTSPYAKLSVVGEGVFTNLSATSTTATSTLAGGLNVGSGRFVSDFSSGNTWLGSGNFGIGTTSPYAKLSVVGETVSSYFTATSTTATSTFPYLTSTQVAVTGLTAGSLPYIGTGGILSQNNTNLYWDNTNIKLGIGTSTPTARLSVRGGGTGLNQTFAVFDSTNAATSTFVVLDNGYVGIGTSTPWGRFSVEQGNNDTDVFIVADAGTSTPHMRIDGAGVTTIERLNTGPMTFETNAGVVSWINLNVDSSAATGTIESFTAQIDDVNILTIYGEAAGAGLIGTTSVGVGTTTPFGYFTVNASSTKAALSVWQVNSATQGGIASFYDGGTEVFKIDSAGRVGIGTSTFTSNLTIGDGTTAVTVEIGKGGLCVDSDGGCQASTTGRISAVSFVTASSDLAENYYSDETLAAGDIVLTKGGNMVGKAQLENQTAVIGIVSTKPGIILGLENDNPTLDMPPEATGIYPVALAGRVPVKVNTENGNISVGDPISLSSEAGVARKASEPGQIIGYALEDYDGPTEENNGQILIFIDITYWFPPDYFSAALTADAADNSDGSNIISQSFEWILEQFKDIGVIIKNGVVQAQEFVAEKITAKKAAVDALEMKDAVTGEIYCVRLENGELNKVLGECD